MGRAVGLHADVLSLVTIQFLIIPDSVNGQQEVKEISIGGFIALGCVAGFVLLVLALSTICYIVRRSRHAKYEEIRKNKLKTKTLVIAKNDSFLNDDHVQPSITGLSDVTRPTRKDKSYPGDVTQECDIQIPDSIHYSCIQSDDYDHHSDTSKFSHSQKDVINEKYYPSGIETTSRSYEAANFDSSNQYSFRRLNNSPDYSDSFFERCKSPSTTVANMLYAKNPKLRNQSGQSSRRDIREPRSASSFGSSVYSVGGAPQSYYVYPPDNYYLLRRPTGVLARPQTEMSTHQKQPHPHQLSWRQEHQPVFVRSCPPLMRSANGGRFYVTNWSDSRPVGSVNYENAKLSSYRPKVLQTIAPVAAYVPTPLAVVVQPLQNIPIGPTDVILPLRGSQFRMVNKSQASPREKVISSVSPPRKKGGKSSRDKLTNREVRHVNVNGQELQFQSNNSRPQNATHIWREVPANGGKYADSRYSDGHEYRTANDSLDFGDEDAETGYIISKNRRTGTKHSGTQKHNLKRNSKIDDEVVIIDYVSNTGEEPSPITVSSDDRYSGLHNTVSQHNSDSNLGSEFVGGRRRQRDPHYGSFEMLPRVRYLK
ncbi:hypothetical protein CHS0354_001782 [Potamilus streckersoni]|uniref:Uncharacterized protein n=1 Tax=Potamilus streckersoni TaxID=2493646 RepID=A0AAE0S4T9_9BIVA|nr:hypothetical protein CHS0354_001782 [Potamilus streckersoni]